MRDIASLRQARATAYDSFAAMQAAAAAENRGMTDEEQAAFDQAAASVEGLDRQIRAAERVQALQASTAIPSPAALRSAEPPEADADQGGGGGTSDQPQAYPPRHYPSARDQVEPGIRFAQCARALIVGRGNVEAAHAFAVNAWGERHEVTAALQANDASAGGFLIPERMSMEMVTLLRPRTVMRRNCHVVPLVGGTDSMPTVESGTAANYIGEGNNIGTSEPTFGLKRFTEREIAALVPISNKLLRNASQNVDFLVRDDMVGAFAQTEDLAFLRSNGVGAAPQGRPLPGLLHGRGQRFL
jgi:HK97 family phage major capsid protein